MTRRRMFATALFLSTASLVKGSGVGLVADRTTPDIRALYQDTDVGVFGRGPGDWEAYDYIETGTTSGGYTIFERQDESGFIYYVGFDGNVTVLAQLVVLDGNVLPDPVPAWIVIGSLVVQLGTIALNLVVAIAPTRGPQPRTMATAPVVVPPALQAT